MSSSKSKRGRGRPQKNRPVTKVPEVNRDDFEEAIRDSSADDEGSSEEELNRPKRRRITGTRVSPPLSPKAPNNSVVVPTGSSSNPPASGDPPIPTDQVALLIAAINKSSAESKKAMEQQLTEFRAEVRRDQQVATDKISRKVRKTKNLEFKQKGNEDQFRFNEQLDEKLDEVMEEMEKLPEPTDLPSRMQSPVRRAKEALLEGKEALDCHQKMIRLADRSEYGWELVKEYAADELADGSDDEKKIRKAEKEAEKKVAGRRKAAANKNKRSFRQTAPRPAYRSQGAIVQPFYEPRPSSFRQIESGAVSRGRLSKGSGPIGPCHICHEYGHLQYTCSKRAMGNKYPLMYCSSSDCEAPLQDSAASVNKGDPMHDSADSIEGDPILLDDPIRQFERTEGDVSLCVKGRLHSNLKYWESILEAPAPIIDIIRQGYMLPFFSVPESKYFKNQKSAFVHSSFVSESIMDLLKNGCIN